MIAFITLLKREISRFCKVLVQTILTPFVSSALYMLVFGVALGGSVSMKDGIPYFLYLLPGLMMMGLTGNAYQNSSSSIVNGKFTGDLEDLRVVPLTNLQIILAMSIAALVRGLIVALVTFIVGGLFYYFQAQQFIEIQHPVYFVTILVLAGIAFGGLGITIAFWAKTFDQLSAFSTFVLLPLTYLGGVFISIEKLSPFWRGLAQFNPLLYFIEGLRFGVIGVSDVKPELTILVGFISCIVTYFFANRSLRPGAFSRW